MTVKELSQLYYLNASIEMMREQLAELREAADIRSPSISDMPRALGLRDKVGDIVPRIADEEAELEEMLLTLKEKGEDAAFQYVRERLRKEKKNRMRKHLNAETDSKTGEELL